LIAALLCAVSLPGAAAFAAKDREQGKEKGENVVLPDTELVDAPTAGILDYYGFQMKTRAYSGGGVVAGLNFGVLERLNLGASMMVDRLIGSAAPIKMRKPEIQVKFRFFDGDYYFPAAALGYDGQGYYYNPGAKKYMEKGRGLYLAGSKEIGLPNFVLHGGFNVPDFDNTLLFGFLGANYTLEDKVAFLIEYDSLFHDDDPARFNVGTRFYITPYFQLDLGVRELGRRGHFKDELSTPRKGERIVQIKYNTNF
jgi:hypothetical protein